MSDVINSYLLLWKKKIVSTICHFFNTWFYTKLTNRGYVYDGRWSSKFGYSIFECEKLFIPIHLNCHSTLVVVDLKNKCLTYLDSYHGENREVLENLAHYLADKARNQNQGSMDISVWRQLFPKIFLSKKIITIVGCS